MPFSIILTEKGGSTQRLDFESEEITIGRVDENDICLPKGNISKKHTKIVVKDEERFGLVRQMWDLLLSGVRPKDIARKTRDEWGFRTLRRGKVGP